MKVNTCPTCNVDRDASRKRLQEHNESLRRTVRSVHALLDQADVPRQAPADGPQLTLQDRTKLALARLRGAEAKGVAA